jgi:hypothetical protein
MRMVDITDANVGVHAPYSGSRYYRRRGRRFARSAGGAAIGWFSGEIATSGEICRVPHIVCTDEKRLVGE